MLHENQPGSPVRGEHRAQRGAPLRVARLYREYERLHPLRRRLRARARDRVVEALGLLRRAPREGRWLRFPYYHHVFDDERRGFAHQLAWMRRHGDFLRLDDAVELLESGRQPDGRYFCITFDDGFRNCLANAVPLLLDHSAPAAFFVATEYVGATPERDPGLLMRFHRGATVPEMLSWDDCREMLRVGMAVGSHTHSHAHLVELSAEEVERELRASREVLERELGVPCLHFACPWGIPGVDFVTDRDPALARSVGYRSFLTTRRGSNLRPSTPLGVERDHTLAAWSTRQLRYFFFR